MRLKTFPLVIFSITALNSISAQAQQTATAPPYMARLAASQSSIATGKAVSLDLFVMDSTSMTPSDGLTITGELSMPSMSGMMLDVPAITHGDMPGHYRVRLTFPHGGTYELKLLIRSSAGKATALTLTLTPGRSEVSDMDEMPGMAGMSDMGGMQMKGRLGSWSAGREGSGTAWQPDSSPMFMAMLAPAGGFNLSAMGIVQAGYVDAGGPRGGKQFFSDSMAMLMAQKDLGGGTLGLDLMTSLDPAINGERGVPDLFQTGETAYGVPLVDRQHPHNLFSEIAGSYSHLLGKDWTGFVYGGPVGEPALGGVMYLHRPSGLEVPEAPITHHWFDSTHISFGVVTLGIEYGTRWKLEGSAFNGHEPGENRYQIGPEELNSASTRLSFNPGKDWSFGASYGFLDSPEALSPGVDEHRTTLCAAYSHNFSSKDNLSITAYVGQNLMEGNPTPSTGWLAEATYYHAKEAFFSRFERVEKDDLYDVPPGNYTINKLVFGDVHSFYSRDQLDYGLGAYAGVYSFPGSLDAYYGRSPVTLGVFVRIRPAK